MHFLFVHRRRGTYDWGQGSTSGVRRSFAALLRSQSSGATRSLSEGNSHEGDVSLSSGLTKSSSGPIANRQVRFSLCNDF